MAPETFLFIATTSPPLSIIFFSTMRSFRRRSGECKQLINQQTISILAFITKRVGRSMSVYFIYPPLYIVKST